MGAQSFCWSPPESEAQRVTKMPYAMSSTIFGHLSFRDLGSILLVSTADVVINRDRWGHSYLTVRGEIIGFSKDEPLRTYLPRMFSLINNGS